MWQTFFAVTAATGRLVPLRIALTHEHSWPDVRRGGERYLHEIAGALARRGHRVTIIAGAKRFSRRREEGVRVYRLARPAEGDLRADRRFVGEIRALLLAGRYDVVHSLGPRDAVQSIWSARPHRHRTTVYTNLGNPVKAWWDQQTGRAWHEQVVTAIDIYGCLSRFALESLRRDFGRDGVLTPGGVRTDIFRPVADRTPNPTLLFSGAITEWRKGVSTLLQAFDLVLRQEPRAELWLSGSGDPAELLAAATSAVRERVIVLPMGTPYDQPERYSRAWATVLPATDEAFGLVLVESLACGTPIVGVNDAAIPELIDEAVGAIAEPADPESLADACLSAIQLASRSRTREVCREASLRHDWETGVVPLIEAAYLAAAK